MAQKPIGYYGEFRPTGVDTSAARRLEAIAGLANQVGDIAFQIGAKKAEQVGAEKGAKAAKEYAAKLAKPQPEVGPPEEIVAPETRKGFLASMSIQDQAYNTALKSGYLAQVSTDAKQEVERIRAQYPNDVQAFQANARQYTQGLLQGVGDDFRDSIESTVNNYVTNAETRVFKDEISKTRELANESVNARLSGLNREVSEMARAGERDQAEVSLLEAATLIDSQLAIDAIDVATAESQKRQLRINLEGEIFKSELDFDIESSNYSEAYKKLREFDKPESFTADEWESFKSSAATDISRNKSIYDASRKTIDENVRQDLKNIQTSYSLGWKVSPEDTLRVEQAVSGTPLQKEFERSQRLGQYSLMPTSERRTVMAQADTGILKDAEEYAQLQVTESRIQAELTKDPLSFGSKQGLVDLVDFDWTDPDSLSARVNQAEGLSIHYGVDVPPITSGEAQALSNQISLMTAPEKVILANTLQQSPSIWGAIAGKNQAVFAQAGAIGNENIMTSIFQGQDELAAGNVVMPPKKEYFDAFNDYVGDVYNTEDKASTRQAVVAYYASLGPEQDFEPDLFQESMDAVTGGISTFNGYRLQLPRGIPEDKFEEFIDSIDEQYILDNGGIAGMSTAVALSAIKRSRISSVADNKYQVMADGYSALVKPSESTTEMPVPFIIEYDESVIARARSRQLERESTAIVPAL